MIHRYISHRICLCPPMLQEGKLVCLSNSYRSSWFGKMSVSFPDCVLFQDLQTYPKC